MANDDTTAAQTVTALRGAAARKQFAVPTDDDELIAWLQNKLEQGKQLTPTNQMKLNLAFTLGQQWLTWDNRTRNFRRATIDVTDPNAPVRVTDNKVGGLVERHVAMLTRDAPIPECRPVSNSDDDVSAARVGTRVLAHETDRLTWEAWLQKFLFWPAALGHGYAYVWWDAEAGGKVGTLEEDEYEEGENPDLYEGQVCVESVPPFELAVDPSATEMRFARWAIRTTTMTREAAWERWDVSLQGGGTARSLAQEVHALAGDAIQEHGEDWVNVHQLWMEPCKAAPKGKLITWSGNTVIENKDFPYDHGKLPFVQCDQIPGLGTREGRTFVTDLVPIQTDLNDSLSRWATTRRQLSPKFVGAVGQVDPQRVTSRVETILYMPGVANTPPHYEAVNPAWGQQYREGIEYDKDAMSERAGVNDASKGLTAATAPAAGIMALQEADTTKLSLSSTSLAAFIAECGKQIILLCKQYWTEERTVRTWSDDNVVEAYRYNASDIADGLDVHVSSESAMPRSKSARIQLIMELQARFPGLLDPQTFVNMLDLPGTDLLTRSLDVDTRKQHRELGQLIEGENPAVKPYDNHVVHLKVINDFRKSIDYEKMDVLDQARIDAHAAVHESLVLKQLGLAVPNPNPTVDPTAQAQAEIASAGAGAQGPQTEGGAPSPSPQGTPAAPMSDNQAAGIGGPGQPGQVPGISTDTQAFRMGN